MHKKQVEKSGYSMLERTVHWAGAVTQAPTLSIDDLQPALSFLLIWSMFEQVNAPTDIRKDTLLNLCGRENFSDVSVKNIFLFFKKTYFPQGCESARFKKLLLKKDENWVREIFTNSEPNTLDMLKASMMVIYRFRNNLAHGLKSQIKINVFWKEFSYINDFLKTYLNRKLAVID